MFPFWLIAGSVVILLGIFDRKLLQLLGFQPLSEVFKTPNLKQSTKAIEGIGRWLVITLGISFLVQGLGKALPGDVGYAISFVLLGVSALLLIAMFGIALANWRAK